MLKLFRFPLRLVLSLLISLLIVVSVTESLSANDVQLKSCNIELESCGKPQGNQVKLGLDSPKVQKLPSADTLYNPGRSANGLYKHWSYFQLKDTLLMKVLYHELAITECGRIMNWSLTIGVIEKGDTIRVLESCNTDKSFQRNEVVRVFPVRKSILPFSHIGDWSHYYADGVTRLTGFDVSVVRTTEGRIERK